MAEYKQKSFEFANDAIKLVLTLATGVLAFTLTFLKDIIGSNPIVNKGILNASWVMLLISILFCILTLFAIAGTLDELEDPQSSKTIYSSNIRRPSFIAILFFLAGMLLMTIFTWSNFSLVKTGNNEKSKTESIINRDTTVIIIKSSCCCAKQIYSGKKICSPSRHTHIN